MIPFFFQDNYPDQLREDIKRALFDLGSNTCIDFRLVNAKDRSYDSKIKILSGSGCYSYVGFQGVSEQEISIRSLGCVSRGTVQHEFMHALGFYHEQARPDAKKYIEVKVNIFYARRTDMIATRCKDVITKVKNRLHEKVRF